jgi:hypothetical protein
MRIVVAPLALLCTLSACATIVSGASQSLAVDTSPEGADCQVAQAGFPVGEIPRTPGSVHIARSGVPVEVVCTKPGFQPTQQMQGAGVNGRVFGNILIGGLIGVVVDMASGAVYHYNSDMMLALDNRGTAPTVAGFPFGYAGTAPVGNPARQADQAAAMQTDAQRYYAATGRYLPPDHGLVRLPPTTPNGDYTLIWPRSETN